MNTEYEYSDKQTDVLSAVFDGSLGFINILEGSVRSGKTWIANLAWVLFVLESPHDKFLMSGESTDSLYRNVIGDIVAILGDSRVKYRDSAKGGASLIVKDIEGKSKIIYCRGGSKANDESKIRGITIGGWYADEITLHHESFVKQALTRLSLKGAKAIWTTNPDSPFHFIKKEYIDKAKEKGYRHWHFNLNDNLTLTADYKSNIEGAYSGVFYDRFIKGLWVLADGIIFDMFSEAAHVVPEDNTKTFTRKVISIDFGMQNPTTFGMFAKEAGTGQWYKTKEYHHSGREDKQQKTIGEYIADLLEFMDGERILTIVDPSAAAFIEECRRAGIPVKKAKNDVAKGIIATAKAIKGKQILFYDCCKETFKEFATYIWDAAASLKGEDKPVKENDHHMDGLRYFVNTILNEGGMNILK